MPPPQPVPIPSPPFAWECIFTDDASPPRSWTWRAPVPGGWLYRHRSVPFERVVPVGGVPVGGALGVGRELVPIAVESMVFVPDPTAGPGVAAAPAAG